MKYCRAISALAVAVLAYLAITNLPFWIANAASHLRGF